MYRVRLRIHGILCQVLNWDNVRQKKKYTLIPKHCWHDSNVYAIKKKTVRDVWILNVSRTLGTKFNRKTGRNVENDSEIHLQPGFYFFFFTFFDRFYTRKSFWIYILGRTRVRNHLNCRKNLFFPWYDANIPYDVIWTVSMITSLKIRK